MKPLQHWLVIILLLITSSSFSQVTIEGAQCVMPGLQYQYFLHAVGNVQPPIQICVSGGKLTSGDSCITENTVPDFLLVVWAGSGSHKIDITSASGNATLGVIATHELQGGEIEQSDKIRQYDQQQSIYTFHCSEATGGACNPHYNYVWQRSDDATNWTNIEGANDEDLEFSDSVSNNIFFRRMVTETASGITAFSDMAQILFVVTQ